MPQNNDNRPVRRNGQAIGILPQHADNDPQLLARMTTDPIACNSVIEAMVWKAIYYAKSADIYSAGPYRSQGNEAAFLESVHAVVRLIAQHILRARQEGYVVGQNEGRGYERKKDTH